MAVSFPEDPPMADDKMSNECNHFTIRILLPKRKLLWMCGKKYRRSQEASEISCNQFLLFQLRPLGSLNKHMLKAHLDDLSNDASHLMSLRLDYLVRYILCCFFFPQKTYDLPKELLEFSGFADFYRYNWPQAIHRVLDDQLPRLAEKAKLGDGGIGLGYIGGCSIVLVIWILELTKYCDVPHPEARPRICRYSEKTNISFEACKTFSRCVKRKVLSVMVDITPSEAELIMDEDEVQQESPLTSNIASD